jgi:hypothetical protein
MAAWHGWTTSPLNFAVFFERVSTMIVNIQNIVRIVCRILDIVISSDGNHGNYVVILRISACLIDSSDSCLLACDQTGFYP